MSTPLHTTTSSQYQRMTEGLRAGVFPVNGADFEALSAAVERLTLNDASVSVSRENSAALGAGYRCGWGLYKIKVFDK